MRHGCACAEANISRKPRVNIRVFIFRQLHFNKIIKYERARVSRDSWRGKFLDVGLVTLVDESVHSTDIADDDAPDYVTGSVMESAL